MYVQTKVHSWSISGRAVPSHDGFVTLQSLLPELIIKHVFVNITFAVTSIITAFICSIGIYSEGI